MLPAWISAVFTDMQQLQFGEAESRERYNILPRPNSYPTNQIETSAIFISIFSSYDCSGAAPVI
ncbi:hypothetical protein RIVM261_079220 [Rivularia sp. IAM M-261]|nr:hypothetical protein RIVM261_079220 [Rivularia sp. IAM M-261]